MELTEPQELVEVEGGVGAHVGTPVEAAVPGAFLLSDGLTSLGGLAESLSSVQLSEISPRRVSSED